MKNLHHTILTAALCLSTALFAQNVKIYVSDASGFTTGPWKIMQYDLNGSNPLTFIDEELGWPQDIVFLADQNEVLISNLSTNRITKYNATTGAYIEDFATVPGGPTRMELDSNGVLWVLQ
ncbi:MAG: YncE family protein, partial [Marinirhabdus sp.]